MMPQKPAGCYICYDCQYHLTNERFGYVIPCKEKSNCNKYLSDLAAQKAANQLERRERALNYIPHPHERRR